MTQQEKIEAIVNDALINFDDYQEIKDTYELMCDQYPENLNDDDYKEQTIRDFLAVKSDEEIDELYNNINENENA